ncbi:MAG TPA: PAS domain-containing sensor histidine kinase [Usitatibacter sp.]|nr:PAS domain-containing sensor histidine kinase [Usitatibacter sp.]
MQDNAGRYRELVEQSGAAIYVIEGWRVAYANPRLCEILGYGADEILGMDLADIVTDEDRERLRENRARAAAGDASALVATYRVRRKDGRVIYLGVGGRLIEQEGRRTVLGVAEDLTDRVQERALRVEAEAHYTALAEQSFVGTYIRDEERVLYASPKLLELLGCTREELGPQFLFRFIVEEDRPLLEASRARRAAGAMGPLRTTFRLRRKDGAVRHVEVESKVVEIAGRRENVGIVQDVTDRELSAAALRQSYERMQALSERVLDIQEEERRAISLELHDDVGQSLVALRIGLHRLAERLDPAQAQLLEHCVEVTSSVQRKVREMSLQLHPPELAEVGLREALRWLAEGQRRITDMDIRCDFAGEERRLPAPLESACYRICQEAINNATRHSHAATIRVELAMQAAAVMLAVSDDGVGFDPREQRERAPDGGNLGLIGMEQRARRAGGRLEVRSAPGQGARIEAFFEVAA